MENRRTFYLSLQAILNAVLIGFVAKGLVLLIELITSLAFYGKWSFGSPGPGGNHLGWMVIAVPIIGSLIVGVMARFGSKAIRGHGIPEAMEKIILEDSKIPWPIVFLKPISAAISIGTGGPFGAEGPIIATGGAVGSVIGQIAHISGRERKVLLAAGACAGMAAIFGSPLAAVLLAIELLLFEFSARSIIPVALACATGAAMHYMLFGAAPVFAMASIPIPSASELAIYTGMGLVIGGMATGITWTVYAVEDAFEHLPIHWMWWPALGAVAVGGIGFFAPYTMGVGYDNIRHILSAHLPLVMILSLCFLKYLSWVISLGSGTSGGTLAPLFTIGGSLGLLLGTAWVAVFPSAPINLETAALIGMAALFAGASRAMLTAIVFSLETTGQMNGLLPLLGACTAAYFVSFFFMKGSIMTEKILRRGVEAPDAFGPDLLQGTKVSVLLEAGLGKRNGGVDNHSVLKALPRVVGINGAPVLPRVYATDTAAHAAEMMAASETDTLVVLKEEGDPREVGMITAKDLLDFYSREKGKEKKYHSPMITRKYGVRLRKVMGQHFRG
jgi:CIC family chloride channel protein